MFVIYSQKSPRKDVGEVFVKPSLTDQLADEPLDKLVARFMLAGGKLSIDEADFVIKPDQNGNLVEPSAKDVEAAFDDSATEDVAAMDRADAFEVLEQAREASAVLAAINAKAQAEPRSASGALKEKDAPTDKADFKKSQEEPKLDD